MHHAPLSLGPSRELGVSDPGARKAGAMGGRLRPGDRLGRSGGPSTSSTYRRYCSRPEVRSCTQTVERPPRKARQGGNSRALLRSGSPRNVRCMGCGRGTTQRGGMQRRANATVLPAASTSPGDRGACLHRARMTRGRRYGGSVRGPDYGYGRQASVTARAPGNSSGGSLPAPSFSSEPGPRISGNP